MYIFAFTNILLDEISKNQNKNQSFSSEDHKRIMGVLTNKKVTEPSVEKVKMDTANEIDDLFNSFKNKNSKKSKTKSNKKDK